MAKKMTRAEMIQALERITYTESPKDSAEELTQLNLADSLLLLAELDHEHEYNLCRAAAKHLLGEVPEPDEIVPDEF